MTNLNQAKDKFPRSIKKDNFVTINYFVLKTFLKKKRNSAAAWHTAKLKYGAEKVDGIKAIGRIMIVFIFIPIFWVMLDMGQSEWVIQAEKLDLKLGVFGIKLLASQVQIASALFILIMIPIFNYGIYPLVGKAGIKITPLRKIGAGLFIIALRFTVIGLLQTGIQNGYSPSIWWQFLAYCLLSTAEVLVVITGIEYSYTQSPPSMKSNMTSIWWLTYSAGAFFTTMVNVNIARKGELSYFTGDKYFYLFVGIMLIFFLLFLVVSSRIKEKDYLVESIL